MDKGTFLLSFDELQTETSVELQSLQLRSLLAWDILERKLITPTSVGYYREPTADDYPIDLNKGLQEMIKSDTDPEHYEQQKTLHYIMMQKQKPQFDICTTRGALSEITFGHNADWVAIKFKDCIYIKSTTKSRKTTGYQYKLRQHLFVDAPGKMPNTDERLNECKQIYANFSAQLGKFNLIYSAQLTGVENTEQLGDLDDGDVLKQLRSSMVRFVVAMNPKYKFWQGLKCVSNWLFQAHFGDVQQQHKANLHTRLQLLYNFLDRISDLMRMDDCPYSTYVFCIRENRVHYEHYIGFNEHSFLDEEYISFINDQYKEK